MKDISIVLAKAEWCGHCRSFQPIFKLSEKDIKNNDYLKTMNIKYEIYDVDKDKDSFIKKYGEERLNKIDGYPSAFVVIIENNKVNKFEEVNTTKEKEGKTKEEASKDFIKNIEVKLKTMTSENKDKYINTDKVNGQHGGGENIINYRDKYLKYKNKYLELKKRSE